MKKIFAVSIMAVMAVTAANANIASKQYVDDKAATAESNANDYTDSKIGSISATDVATEIANAIQTAGSNQVQANWNETNTDSKAYIQNKPTLGALAAKNEVSTSDLDSTLASTISGKADTSFVGALPAGATATTVTGYIDEAAEAAASAGVADLNLTAVTGVIKSVSQTDGQVAATAGTIVDADVDANAAIAQSKIANLTSDLASKADTSFVGALPAGATATTVTGYIDEAAEAAASAGVADLDYTGATGGNVITQVTQTDGTVSATMGNAIMETDSITSNGTYVLTATKSGTEGNYTYTYGWENIQRGTGNQ